MNIQYHSLLVFRSLLRDGLSRGSCFFYCKSKVSLIYIPIHNVMGDPQLNYQPIQESIPCQCLLAMLRLSAQHVRFGLKRQQNGTPIVVNWLYSALPTQSAQQKNILLNHQNQRGNTAPFMLIKPKMNRFYFISSEQNCVLIH